MPDKSDRDEMLTTLAMIALIIVGGAVLFAGRSLLLIP